MKNAVNIKYRIVGVWGLIVGLMATMFPHLVIAAGPAAVNLGTAGNFVILAKTGVGTTGSTSVVGDIGVSPAAATYITGFGLILPAASAFATSALVTGKVYAPGYADPTPSDLTTAVGDMQTAYTDAAGRAPTVTELGAGNIGGLTLTPGVYKWGTGLTIPTDVTLSGGANDVWIIQIAGTLTVSSGVHINLSGGAQAANVFWQVAGQTTIGTTGAFQGTILDQTAIVLNTGATLNGRALAQTAVTLDGNTVVIPSQAFVSVPSTSMSVHFFAIPSVNSPSNQIAQQNAMAFVDGGTVGRVPSDIAVNSGAANPLYLWRACDTISTVPPVNSWDATNVSAGPFGAEFGKRIAIVLEKTSQVPFLASLVSFDISSSDEANSMHYAGNLGINTSGGAVLNFSPSLRGELWDANGNVIATYHNGEDIASHPINKLTSLIKDGWVCSNMGDVGLDLSYFSSHMTFTLMATYFTPGGDSVTSVLSSRSFLVPAHAGAGNNMVWTLLGQRQLPIALSYGVRTRQVLEDVSHPWTVLFAGGLQDGYTYTSTPANSSSSPQGYYQGFEVIGFSPAAVVKKPAAMIAHGSNAPEW